MKFTLTLLLLCSLSFAQSQTPVNKYSKYVNPFIGTGGFGHTFPGATTPFGMVQLSADTRINNTWEGCSGYHHSDSIIYGFSHTHLSGTGCSDYGDIAFIPAYVSSDVLTEKIHPRPASNSGVFNHKNEKASVGYYSVLLEDIKVELSASTRVGIQAYTFNKDGMVCIQLNLSHRDELLDSKIEKVSETKYQGYRRSKAWAEDQMVYYSFEISKAPILARTFTGVNEGNKQADALFMYYNVKKGEQILIKTGLSSVDEKGASLNLSTEVPHWDFKKVQAEAVAKWDKELSKIEVTDTNTTNKIKFYTALYHCMIHPNVLNDVDGKYRGRDHKIHQADGEYYTLYSLWDTHRALHPLLNIIDKERSKNFIKSFLAQYQQSGRLPMWELWNNETNCMIGFHSVSVILDAYRKDVIDKKLLESLYPAILSEASSTRFGLDKFRKRGYLEIEDESESVSKTLEYAYDMWCVSEIGKILNKPDLIAFGKYVDAWKNVYDASIGYMRPRKNGGWLSPFNPYEVNNHYTEANAWQYSFFIPHRNDIKQNVLPLFQANTKTTGREQSDISGLIGQYAHGNEPSHNYVYLLPLKERQQYIQQINNDLYGIGRDGLCGNDDCGQMSAWFVFSAMGFYPTCPGKSVYDIGYPLFDDVKIKRGDKIICSISKEGNTKMLYPTINSTSSTTGITSLVFNHNEFEKGLRIAFKTTKTGELNTAALSDKKQNDNIVSPVILSERQIFRDFNKIELALPNEKVDSTVELYYSIDSPSTKYAKLYHNPFYLMNSSKVYAFAKKGNYTTDFTEGTYYRMPNNWSVTLRSTYNRQYSADGPEGIIDGLRGDTDWRKGRWQGYQSQDFEVNIDLKTEKEIKEVSAGFLQDTRSWILMPTKVEIYTSNDGSIFSLRATIKNTVRDQDYAVQIKEFGSKIESCRARYVKVVAKNYGTLPHWHQGSGGDAFIFVDEIQIKTSN